MKESKRIIVLALTRRIDSLSLFRDSRNIAIPVIIIKITITSLTNSILLYYTKTKRQRKTLGQLEITPHQNKFGTGQEIVQRWAFWVTFL